MRDSVNFFDESAHEFACSIDGLIDTNQYDRGNLFAQAVKRVVATGGVVLDYGCGPGRLSRLFVEQGFQVLGVDQSAGMIAEATRQNLDSAKAHFEVLSDQATWEDRQYDAVVCSSVVEYVEDVDSLLWKFHEHLKPQGKLIVSFANRRSVFRWLVSRKRGQNIHFTDYQYHQWTGREACRRLELNGFRVLDRPKYLEASAFDKRPLIARLTRSSLIGTLGLIVAEKVPQ